MNGRRNVTLLILWSVWCSWGQQYLLDDVISGEEKAHTLNLTSNALGSLFKQSETYQVYTYLFIFIVHLLSHKEGGVGDVDGPGDE